VASPPGDAIARAVQGIAAALDLVVIAEGVEHEAQRDALRAIGVAQAQGWLWGRAVPPKDFLAPLAVETAGIGWGTPGPAGPAVPAAPTEARAGDQSRSTTTGA